MNRLLDLRVLTFDAALAVTGWAVMLNGVPAQTGLIKTSEKQPMLERRMKIFDEVYGLIKQWQPTHIGVEETDWERGKDNTREQWIVECIAREALGIGVTAVELAAWSCGHEPITMGAKEWMREGFRSVNKASIGEFLAREFPKQLAVQLTADGTERIVVTREGRRLTNHETDALGLGLVLTNRLRQQRRIREAETSHISEGDYWRQVYG